MKDEIVGADMSKLVREVRARTPARLLMGRAGGAFRTETQLELREAHASARDAVRTELRLPGTFDWEFIARWGLFEVSTEAGSKDEYLSRPDLGRRFAESEKTEVLKRCAGSVDLQIVIGDGLSVAAVAAQVPSLLPPLMDGAKTRGWSVGQTFVVRYCRVGLMNQIGVMLDPKVVVLLIGERPGLATAESLSAYMAYRPKPDHTDADRNLISNIHDRGVSANEAAERIMNLAEKMMKMRRSGSGVRE